MSVFSRINVWWVFQILFLIGAVIFVEYYQRNEQNRQIHLTNDLVYQPASSSSQQKNPNNQRTFSDLRVVDARVCLDIDEGQPLVSKESFRRTVDRLYCFTQVHGVKKAGYILHRWYHNKTLRTETKLEISANRTNIWSSIEMESNWAGQWHVDIHASNENLLRTVEFELY
jgi:hypothetical protein